MEFTVYKKQSSLNECTSNRGEHNANPAANHMSHYNLILDSNLKTCVNELIIRNSCNQQSNISFSNIKNVVELYPATQTNSGK